jgi:GTP:adenosylcobinamide-phosphate guanylyltransferase
MSVSANNSAKISAVVLAGSRPGPDPLLDGTGVSSKALLPIAGLPMLAHGLRALRASPEIGTIIILAQDTAALAAEPTIARVENICFETSGQGISHSLAAALSQRDEPVLVTTADHVLLTPQMVAEFVAGARGHDVAVGMVERSTLLARYPESRRTWLKFRAGWWSGANLFWLHGPKVQPLLSFWSSIEKDRKKGSKIFAAFGPVLMIGALLRLFTVKQGIARAGKRFGVRATAVAMSAPEACIDADKPDDVRLIEKILATR